MEVANLSDLSLTFSGVGLQTLSANTVPINIYIGNGTPFNPSYVNLNSDNFSSGRRRVGMIVYVNETGFAYQYEIDNYESLWNAATGATGTVTTNLYDTQVRNNSAAGQNFINAWTGSTIEGVSGTTRTNAKWRIFHGTDTFITGGTYFSATSTIDLYRNDGVTIPISGITATGGSSSSGFTGGTVSGATNFTGGLTANTISATTYVNLPTDIRTTGGTYSNNTFTFTNNTGGTYSVLFNTVTGLTINGNLTTTGNTSLQGVTATTISATTYLNLPSFTGDYLPLSGGTVSGVTNFNGGLTANTISATTYQNLPNTTFTGGTVSGATNFTNGLTANTISATTLSLRNVANTFNGSFTNTNTADRVYTLPDATGTIALTSDLSSYVTYSGLSAQLYRIVNTADGVTTSANTLTLIYSQLIPANTFATGDVIRISYRGLKIGSVSGSNAFHYVHTASTVSSATLLATFSTSQNIRMIQMDRKLYIKNVTGNTEMYNTTVSSSGEYTLTATSTFTNIAINWTINQYIIFANTLNSTSDSFRGVSYEIERIRQT
jgi:hypothetical protein